MANRVNPKGSDPVLMYKNGAIDRIRTCDLFLRREAFFQLNYDCIIPTLDRRGFGAFVLFLTEVLLSRFVL